MLTTPDVAGLVTMLAAVPAPFLMRYVRDNRAKPGVVWFMLNVAAVACWSLVYGLVVFVDDPQVTAWLLAVDLAVVSVVVISWFLFVLEFTHQVSVPWRRVMVPLFIPVFMTQVLVWTNPTHNLVYTAESYVDAMGVPHFQPGPWYAVSFGYDVLFPIMALGMLVGEFITTRGYRRRQTAVLLVATLVPMAAAVAFALELSPQYLNPAPISFVVVGALVAVALRRYHLLRVKPVPRRTTLDEIEEAVVTVSTDGTVLDLNPAARSLFEFSGGDPAGRLVRESIEEFGDLVADLASGGSVQTETSGEFDGETRHFVVNSSPVEYGRGGQCQAVVFRDITALKQRERDLRTLKQLLSRVFRHNVRNELTKLVGRAEVIREQHPTAAPHVEYILDTCRTLQAHSDKARLVERVIDEEGARTPQVLRDVLARVVEDVTANYPSARVETDVPGSVAVLANVHLEDALYNVIENAIEHNESPDPVVEVAVQVDDDTVVVQVSDDGPGIPDREVEVLERRTETALEHGSGVGLWLVNLVIEKSGGHLDIRGGPDGTTVEVRLQRADSLPDWHDGDADVTGGTRDSDDPVPAAADTADDQQAGLPGEDAGSPGPTDE